MPHASVVTASGWLLRSIAMHAALQKCFIVRDANGEALASFLFRDSGAALGGQAAHEGRDPAGRANSAPPLRTPQLPSLRG
jgi:hypothetical protein